MFLKEAINKNIFDQNGYVLLDTSLNNNQLFDNLINEIENSLSEETNSSYIRKLGGYIMGNFGRATKDHMDQDYSHLYLIMNLRITSKISQKN